MDNYDALINLLPESIKAWVLVVLQLVAVLSLAVPVLEKLVKLTPTKADDKALEVVQRVLSMFPRVTIPRLSQRPPAPVSAPETLQVQWPAADRVAAVTQPKPPAADHLE